MGFEFGGSDAPVDLTKGGNIINATDTDIQIRVNNDPLDHKKMLKQNGPTVYAKVELASGRTATLFVTTPNSLDTWGLGRGYALWQERMRPGTGEKIALNMAHVAVKPCEWKAGGKVEIVIELPFTNPSASEPNKHWKLKINIH